LFRRNRAPIRLVVRIRWILGQRRRLDKLSFGRIERILERLGRLERLERRHVRRTNTLGRRPLDGSRDKRLELRRTSGGAVRRTRGP
jgi:hypothetical protein